MEKMTSEPTCNHLRVYAPCKSTERTNTVGWICRFCGVEGTEVVEGFQAITPSEYDQLKAKKATGGFPRVV